MPDGTDMTEQHLGTIADYLETRKYYIKAGTGLGFGLYRLDTFREQGASPWEAAHRMLIAWKTSEPDNSHKWQVILNVLTSLLRPCEMQELYDKLMAINIKEAQH